MTSDQQHAQASDGSAPLKSPPQPPSTDGVAFHFSLSELLWLFVLLAVLLAVISVMPWLAVPIIPLTITGVRTHLVAKHRRLAGRPLSIVHTMEIMASTLILSVMCCLSLVVAAFVAWQLGAFLQAAAFGIGREHWGLAAVAAAIAVGLLGFAWWRTIKANWSFDMHSTGETFAVTEEKPQSSFRFGLANILELTTLVAVVLAVGQQAPALAVVVGVPFISAMIYTWRFANRREARKRPVSFLERYSLFVRAYFLTALFLASVAVALIGGGWFVGVVIYQITGDQKGAYIVAGFSGIVLAVAVVAAAWFLRLKRLFNEDEAIDEPSAGSELAQADAE